MGGVKNTPPCSFWPYHACLCRVRTAIDRARDGYNGASPVIALEPPLRKRAIAFVLTSAVVSAGCVRTLKATLPITINAGLTAGPSHAPVPPSSAPTPAVLAAGAVQANQGTLVGTVLGPSASLISDNASTVVSDHGSGLVANNGGSLIANNSGSLIGKVKFALLADDATALAPVADASIDALGPDGQPLPGVATTTDAAGNFTLSGLPPSTPLVFLRARYAAAGENVILMTLCAAPRGAGSLAANLTPASSLVAKKILTGVRQGQVSLAKVSTTTVNDLTRLVGPVMSGVAIVAAAVQSESDAAGTFDLMLTADKPLADAVSASATAAGVPELLSPASSKPLPSPLPSPSPLAASPSPSPTGTSPSAGISPVPSATGGPVASPSPASSASPAPGPSTSVAASVAPSQAPSLAQSSAPASIAPSPQPTATPAPAQVQAYTLATAQNNPNNTLISVALDPASLAVSVANRQLYTQDGTLSGFTAPIGLAQQATSGKPAARTYAGGTCYTLDIDNQKITWPGGEVDSPLFSNCFDLAVSGGFAYVSGDQASCIYRVDLSSGSVDILAGSASATGLVDGTGSAARFNRPSGITLAGGNLYVADNQNQAIRQVTLAGQVKTFAGGTYGSADGVGTAAGFKRPMDVTADDAGNLYVADFYGNTVRRIGIANRQVTTIAGGASGSVDGTGSQIGFDSPISLAWGRLQGQPVLVVGELHTSKLRLVSFWH